jgi:hypothetical protein
MAAAAVVMVVVSLSAIKVYKGIGGIAALILNLGIRWR